MSERESGEIGMRANYRSARSVAINRYARSAVLRRLFATAALAALVFALAAPNWAQSASPATKSAAAGINFPVGAASAIAGSPTQAATPKAGAQLGASAGQSAAKGQHEGIIVHGHWIIEVRNPDGSLVKHVEFENSLSPELPLAGTDYAGGGALLSAVMAGQATSPSGWLIFIEGVGGINGSTTGAPCTPLSINGGFAGTTTYTACFLLQNSSTDPFAAECGATPAVASVSCNLAVSLVTTGSPPSVLGFQLSGSVAATQSGDVSAVQTLAFGACGPTATLANCPFAGQSGGAAFTYQMFDGNTVPGDPLPVKVTVGQMISVTVDFTFQ